MNTLYLIGKILFGGYFIMNGIMHFMHMKNMVGYSKMKNVPMPSFAVTTTGLLLLLGGLGLLLNIQMYYSLILLLIFLIPVTFKMHAFWSIDDVNQKMAEKVNFFKNLALIGAILMMF